VVSSIAGVITPVEVTYCDNESHENMTKNGIPSWLIRIASNSELQY